MKRALSIVALIVVVVVGSLAALPFLIPTDIYKRQIETRASGALGREVTIAGGLRLGLLPRVALRAGDVRVAGEGGADLARIETLELDVALAPLLGGVLAVDRLVLVRPVIELGIGEDGRGSWEPAAAPAGPGTASGPLPVPLRDLAVAEVRIEVGTLRLHDARDGRSETLEAVDVALTLESLDRPATLDGSLHVRGEPVAVSLALARPRDLLLGRGSDLGLELGASGAEAAFRGRIESLEPLILAGRLEAGTAELRRVAAWLAEPPPLEPGGLERAALSAELALTGERVRLSDLRVAVDDIEGEGTLEIDLVGPRPAASGELRLGRVDLGAYRAIGTEPQAAPSDAPAAEGWSEDPIVLPVPPGVDIDVVLELEALVTPQARLGATRAVLRAEPERMRVDLERAALYGGSGSGWLQLTAREDGPPLLEQRLVLEGVALRSLLADVMEVDHLDGRADIELSLASRGVNERQLVRALAGEGRMTVRDGVLIGIDLASVIQDATRLVLDPQATARRTEITRLDASFAIRDGILRNRDLSATAPLIRITGEGEIDLGRRTIPGFRLLPRAVASVGGADGPGFGVPVEISGPWDDLRVRVDLAGALGRAVPQPEALREQLEGLGEGVREGLRELGRDEGVRDLREGLRDLFRR
jgi:AsmA protein